MWLMFGVMVLFIGVVVVFVVIVMVFCVWLVMLLCGDVIEDVEVMSGGVILVVYIEKV